MEIDREENKADGEERRENLKDEAKRGRKMQEAKEQDRRSTCRWSHGEGLPRILTSEAPSRQHQHRSIYRRKLLLRSQGHQSSGSG